MKKFYNRKFIIAIPILFGFFWLLFIKDNISNSVNEDRELNKIPSEDVVIDINSAFTSDLEKMLLTSDSLTIYKNTDTSFIEIRDIDHDKVFKFLRFNNQYYYFYNNLWYKNSSEYNVNFSHEFMVGNIFDVIYERPELVEKSHYITCGTGLNCTQYYFSERFNILIDEDTKTIYELTYLGEEFKSIYNEVSLHVAIPDSYINISNEYDAKDILNRLCNNVRILNKYYICESSTLRIK